jgi:hypothetical protein
MKMNKDCCIHSTTRKGGSILTNSGILFWPMDARESEVRITDIAHALSNMCRFAGHVNHFYSVAQHCVLVSELIAKEKTMNNAYCQYVGLLHDASEAYLVDVPRPIKQFLRNYQVIEHKLQRVIADAFGISKGSLTTDFDAKFCHDADNLALAIEAKNLVNDPSKLWTISAKAGKYRKEVIPFWSPTKAKKEFLKRFALLEKAIWESQGLEYVKY